MLVLTPKADFIPTEVRATVWKTLLSTALSFHLLSGVLEVWSSREQPFWACSNYPRPVRPCLPHWGWANGGGTRRTSLLSLRKEERDWKKRRMLNREGKGTYICGAMTTWWACGMHSEHSRGSCLSVPVWQMRREDSETLNNKWIT